MCSAVGTLLTADWGIVLGRRCRRGRRAGRRLGQAAVGDDALNRIGQQRHFAVVPEDGYILGGAGWLEAGQARMGGPSWADPEAYVANSPVYRADRIRTPVLIVHGDLDPVSAETMFANLYQLGREAGLLTFWGEGHVLMSPANIRELHERLLAWLDRYMAASGEPSLPVADPDL